MKLNKYIILLILFMMGLNIYGETILKYKKFNNEEIVEGDCFREQYFYSKNDSLIEIEIEGRVGYRNIIDRDEIEVKLINKAGKVVMEDKIKCKRFETGEFDKRYRVQVEKGKYTIKFFRKKNPHIFKIKVSEIE